MAPPLNYLDVPCGHIPTPEEKERDRDYLGCFSLRGEACVWAKRFDGATDPLIHSERVEAFAALAAPSAAPIDTETFDRDVLETGLI